MRRRAAGAEGLGHVHVADGRRARREGPLGVVYR